MALSKAKALTLEECHCLLCMEFLIEPITLPCNHTMCKSCFKALLRKTKLFCPFCRSCISSWARNHTHVDSLINKELWETIQSQYPEECRRRDPGEERPSLVFNDDPPVRLLSNPGELRKEYEEEMIRMEAERQAIEERQNRATEEFIWQLLAKEFEEEKLWEEKRRLEEQQQREAEKAKKSCTSDPVTSPRKKKSKQKHCDNVPKFSLPQAQLESALQYETVQASKKTSGRGQGTKTEENMPAATLSTGPGNPKQGTLSSRYAIFHSYDAKVGSSDEAPKPSCSNYDSNIPFKNIKPEATTHSSVQIKSMSSESGIIEEIGSCTTEAKEKMPPSSRKHTSKRKHQEYPSEAEDGEPGISHEISPKSSSDDKETQDLITKKLKDLEQLYYEKHLQEEQDRLFALKLQKALDEEEKRKRWSKKSLRNYPVDYDAFDPDTSAKKDSKDKNI
ncbi:E3 ubiquitin-protein ligase RNF168-like [Grammomys surdaster]|uniref:E3 ubiquitin-protein ligase RNF168-like n=1 Tax=Grammomys surdaster TaxID=491861 RepID=UPI0010A01DEA|nr:E3 ubiquitin-protein ligase RNF168-like [Grammomys surdaster]